MSSTSGAEFILLRDIEKALQDALRVDGLLASMPPGELMNLQPEFRHFLAALQTLNVAVQSFRHGHLPRIWQICQIILDGANEILTSTDALLSELHPALVSAMPKTSIRSSFNKLQRSRLARTKVQETMNRIKRFLTKIKLLQDEITILTV